MVEAARIAVDAMGGDGAPGVVVRGALQAQREHGVPVVLVGDHAAIEAELPAGARVAIEHAPDVFGMSEAPASLRRRPGTSIRVAARLVRERRAAAMVSCGHSGATLLATVIDIGLIPGVDRPAIAIDLPTAAGGRMVLLDAGASTDCRPDQLLGFASLGAAYANVLGIEEPRVGLLSIGEEDGKGNALVQATLPLLRELPLHVVGNIEPHHAHAGACDVLVTDGFSGNVFLKSAEGAVETVVGALRAELGRSVWTRLGGWLLGRALHRVKRRTGWDSHGGALLLGADGVVVVGHGRANEEAACAAVRRAHYTSTSKLVEAVGTRLTPHTAPPDRAAGSR